MFLQDVAMRYQLGPAPPPFPRRAFMLIGAAWILVDSATMLLLWHWASVVGWSPLMEIVIIAWQATLGARAMLMLGWWFLGEGEVRHRVTGVALFAPLLAPPLVLAFFEPDVLCMLAMAILFAVPGAMIAGLPYVGLQLMDYRLARDAPPSEEKIGQFTVRQLMLITLVAAIVLGLLRWTQLAELNYALLGLLVPLLAWVYPPVACLGLLHERWYPRVVYAVGLTAWLLALPLFALPEQDAVNVMLFVGMYVVVFTGHLLLLRGLGFRLVKYRPRAYYDPGIVFIDPEDPGIVWVGEGKRGTASQKASLES